MKKYKLLTYIAFAVLFLPVGCKKFLEHQPDNRSGLNSPEEIADLVAAAYPQANYIPMAESMSDNAGDKGMPERDLPNSLAWTYADQIDGTTADTPPFYWNACYNAIAAANYALEAIDKAGNTAAYAASRGEALVARAYAHFMLVTFFAKAYDPATASSDLGIPYLTQPQKIVDGSYTRGTVAGVYANIEKDLEEGLPLIKDKSYKVPKYHFTKQSAHAFATRFYLFKKEYKKVIEHANAAFPGTTISDNLRPWNTIYINLGYYELQALYTNSTEPTNLLLREVETIWSRNIRLYNYGLSDSVSDIFYISNPSGKYFVIGEKMFGNKKKSAHIPKFREHFVKNSINARIGYAYNMIPLFTSEEVLFNRAEASVMVGNYTQALSDINIYLSKRIMGYSADDYMFTTDRAIKFFKNLSERWALLNSILFFKRMEYMQEGLRWFDIIRLKIPIEHASLDNKIKITLDENDPRRVLQIPPEAIKAGLEPNPR